MEALTESGKGGRCAFRLPVAKESYNPQPYGRRSQGVFGAFMALKGRRHHPPPPLLRAHDHLFFYIMANTPTVSSNDFLTALTFMGQTPWG